eukprot:1161113-Pelagomonas_calceolata.AAC.4
MHYCADTHSARVWKPRGSLCKAMHSWTKCQTSVSIALNVCLSRRLAPSDAPAFKAGMDLPPCKLDPRPHLQTHTPRVQSAACTTALLHAHAPGRRGTDTPPPAAVPILIYLWPPAPSEHTPHVAEPPKQPRSATPARGECRASAAPAAAAAAAAAALWWGH